MADMEIHMSGHDELLKLIESLGESEKNQTRILNAAAGPLEQALKAQSAKHQRTGAMQGSIKPTTPKPAPSGDYYTVVRPTGKSSEYIAKHGRVYKRKKPVRNMAKMAYLEFGTEKMAADPIITRAVEGSRNAVYDAMQDEYNKIVAEAGG